MSQCDDKNFSERVFERLESLESKIDEMNHLITGNGTPERGLLVRIDRVERNTIDPIRVAKVEEKQESLSKVAAWFFAIMGTVAAGVVVLAITTALKGAK